MIELERLEELKLCEVFDKGSKGGEAHAFTPWLEKNISLINDLLDINLSNPHTEERLDTLRVDIVATAGNEDEKTVIIENQFGDSNSEHLGKLLAYAAYKDSDYAIWIVEHARAEHIRAVQMLNELSEDKRRCAFFIIEARCVKVGDSKPALWFDLVASPGYDYAPSEEQSAGQKRRRDFWARFVEKLHIYDKANKRTPTDGHWIDIYCGTTKFHYSFNIRRGSYSVQLWFTSEQDENKKNFDYLEEHKEKIEETFGSSLYWRRMTEKKSSSVAFECKELGGIENEKGWDKIADSMIAAYDKMKSSLEPYISKLK